jgi:hypothetical protein
MSAHDHLNYRQVGGLMKRANSGGGFSVKAYGPNVGKEAEGVHMVGGAGGAGQNIFPPEVGHDVEATTEQGMSYVEQRKGLLSGPRSFFGGWHGGNRIALDVSHSYPQTRRGTMRARKAAVRRGEESFATLGMRTPGGSQSYDETVNPYYGKTTSLNTETRAWANEPINRRRGSR